MAAVDDFAPGNRHAFDDRRRSTAPVSARSSLLTILGEFALPRESPVWTGTVVAALGALGVEEKAARQALARLAAEDLLAPERVGRRTRWLLSPRGSQLLEEGATRIYGFMREQSRWDGTWLILAVTIPETQRQLRHALRTRLTWAGMGSPAPGLWVTPNHAATAEIVTIVEDLALGDKAMSWVGTSAEIGDPQQVVRAAWQLQEVEQEYAQFIEEFSGRRPRQLDEIFLAQVDLVQSWRRFPFADPALPLELLDHEWPGPAAASTFRRCHELWHRQAQLHWKQLSQDA